MKTVLQKFIILLICFFSLYANAQSSGVSIASINPPHGWIIIGNTYFPTISIHNDTTFNVDSIVISCFVNGTLIGTESYLPIITPNNTGQLFFSTSFMAVTGTNELCVTIDSVKGVATYDTLCVTLIGLPTLIPTYTDDFESANIGWLAVSADTKTNWELGTPNFGATNSANSGTSAWDINLTSGYDTSAHAELYSPFFDCLNVINPRLSFWQNRNVEANNDGFRLELSADGGMTWSVLGSVNDTNAINWYTRILNSTGLPAWDSSSGGWQQSSYINLSFINGNVLPVVFRFVFTSNATVNYDGVSIDDFSFYRCIIAQTVVSNYVTCSAVCDGALSINIFQGTPPFSFQWNNGATTQTITNLCPGQYTVIVTDLNGCSTYGGGTLPFASQNIFVYADSVTASGCGSSNGSFHFSSTASTYTAYVNGVASGPTTNLSEGIYSLYLIAGACLSDTIQIVVPDSCEDVWPGDANYDLTVNNLDLMWIGLANGNTGPVRPSATNNWTAQPCPDWSNWFFNGINQKHADCDGNGLIDNNDGNVVILNYGLTHPLKPNNVSQVNTAAPDLYLDITQDTTGLSSLVNVDVYCATALNPIDSIYGLAFTLQYDPYLTDVSTASYDIANTFFGTPGVDVISIDKNFTSGYDDFAITRTNHQNISGHGLVCRFSITTTGSIPGNYDVLNFSLSNVTAITANENTITLDAFGDSVFIDSTLNGINYLNWDASVKVYPNPANNYFTVSSTLTNISKISIVNQLGEIVYSNLKPHLSQNINVAAIPNGVYVLRIETKDGVIHRKIQIIR